MIKKDKCSGCKEEVYRYINGVGFCFKHYVKEYYSESKECVWAELDTFIDNLSKGKRLDKEQKKFLNELKRQFPEVKSEFPRLFKEK